MGRFAILVLLVGCYSPSVMPGAPCSTEGTCPSGLMCIADRCLLGPEGSDGALDSPADAVSDASIDAMVDALPNAMWSVPTLVPGVNTSSTESDPTFTTNRLLIAFTRSNEIYFGVRASVNDAFSVVIGTALNSAGDERSPELSPDGLTIYFTSDRLVAGDEDIYTSTRSGTTWSAPTRVNEISTTGNGEADLAISPDGLTMVLIRSGDFRRSTRATTADAWGAPLLISGTFGTSATSPSLTTAGDLYFHADSARNVYVARKQGTGFGSPINVTELNTTGRDAAPFVAPDERHLMFERDGQIYEAFR